MRKGNEAYKARGKWIFLNDTADPVCVITGGSCGLGKEIVSTMIKKVKGIKIVILDIVKPEPELYNNEQLEFFSCDLSNLTAVDAVIEKILQKYSTIHILINNAAIRGRFSKLVDFPGKDMETMFNANVLAGVRLMQAFYPKRSTDQYYVINVASSLGILSPARASTYAATKAALISYHESWTYELARDKISNVRTMLVLTGQMDTQMFRGFEPPRQFFAPIVKCSELAEDIVNSCIKGTRGEIHRPLYSYFSRIVKCLPDVVMEGIRTFSKMDECLPVQ